MKVRDITKMMRRTKAQVGQDKDSSGSYGKRKNVEQMSANNRKEKVKWSQFGAFEPEPIHHDTELQN
eukprot:15636740-Heterocapsa_arctica.AAC.1